MSVHPMRMIPDPVGADAEFYGHLARGELHLRRCTECRTWRHPPRLRCPTCGSAAAAWERASGLGRVFSWTVTHQPIDPAFTPPYAVVVVELEEGPRLVGNLVGAEPSELALDRPVCVEVEPVSDRVALVQFRLV